MKTHIVRSRWVDISDQFSEVVGSGLVTQSGYYYEVIPYNTKVKIYDDQTNKLLEAHANLKSIDKVQFGWASDNPGYNESEHRCSPEM